MNFDIYPDYGNPYDAAYEDMQRDEYLDYKRLKMHEDLKGILLYEGIPIHMMDSFIKMLEFSYFEGCDEAIELVKKLGITKTHLVSHRDENWVRNMIKDELDNEV